MKREAVRSAELNLLSLTRAKNNRLSSLFSEYVRVANEILSELKSKKAGTETSLHDRTYTRIRENSRLPAQLVCAARQDVWAKRKHMISMFRRLSVSYNVPRSGSITQTRRGNPVLSVATLDGRIGVPVAMDGAWQRLCQLLADR